MTERYVYRPRVGGFTLIELMITVVIATILLTVAIPMYLKQIRESRRTEARSALLDLAGREERYYAINNTYTQTASYLGYTAWNTPIGSGYYQIQQPTIAAATSTAAASFTLTAVPVTGKGQDQDSSCQKFQVYSTGQDASQDGSSNDTTSTCWSN